MPILIRDAANIPQPPSEIVARLQAWEPALGLKYHAVQWAFTWSWKPSDVRWEWVRKGAYSAADAYDIIGYIPLDCSMDEIPAYATRALRAYPRDEIRKLCDSVGLYNAEDALKGPVAAVLDEVLGGTELGKHVTGNSGFVNVPEQIHSVVMEPVVMLAEVLGEVRTPWYRRWWAWLRARLVWHPLMRA